MNDSNVFPVHLSVTIGPVQSFVAASRRTRDLWAGSWLLSHLCEHALAAAERASGYIAPVIPYRTEKSRKCVTGETDPVGKFPNRFEVKFESPEAAETAGKLAIEAVQSRFRQIADDVWQEYVGDAAKCGRDVVEIWNRQVDSFWECSFVVAAPLDNAKTIGALVAARKHFRNVHATIEGGVKCSLIPTLQELSGCVSRDDSDAFWTAVRKNVSSLDLGEKERLSAIAVIKRLFPLLDSFKELNARSWPSTSFFAAHPWLTEIVTDDDDEKRKLAEAFSREATSLSTIQKSEQQSVHDHDRFGLPNWASIDATAWYAGNFEAGQTSREWDLSPEQARDFKKRLKEIAGDKPPLRYYALLMMDGDSMGLLLSQLEDSSKLSEMLDHFSTGVDDIVARHHGKTVYAGGDDVMALLPAKDALAAADALAQSYSGAAEETQSGLSKTATISAAILYLPTRFPLQRAIRMAHTCLDDIAKEETGRDSVAFAVLNGNDIGTLWSAPWDVIRGNASASGGGLGVPLTELIDRFASGRDDDSPTDADDNAGAEESSPQIGATFLHHIRSELIELLDVPIDQPGRFGSIKTLEQELIAQLVTAQWRRRMSKKAREKTDPASTKTMLRPVVALSQEHRRKKNGEVTSSPEQFKIETDSQKFGFDGWRAARFLKQVADGRMEDHS